MRTFFSESHRLHFPQAEISGGEMVTPFERPSRIEYILRRLHDRQMRDIVAPDALDSAPINRLFDPGYLDFLEMLGKSGLTTVTKGRLFRLHFQ